MNRSVLRALLQTLAEHHGWRHRPDTHEAFAVHRGVGVHVAEEDGLLYFLFFAPDANVGEEILEGFAGFTHCDEGGLPPSWFRGRTEDDHSCLLRLDGEQLEELDQETFLALPDLVAEDFRTHGAAEEFPCHHCGERPAEDVRLIDTTYHGVCRFCSQLLEVRTVGGKLASGLTVRWGAALLRLAGVTVAIGVAWGWLLHWSIGNEKGMTQQMAAAVALLLGGAGAWLTLPRGSAVTWGLRAVCCGAVAAAVALGTLTACIVYIRGRVPWITLGEALEWYLTVQVPENLGHEIAYPLACAAGMFGGLWLCRPGDPVRVR